VCNGERKMTEILCPFFFDPQFTNPCWLSKSKSAVSIRRFERTMEDPSLFVLGKFGFDT
jgi:hypothetical protein